MPGPNPVGAGNTLPALLAQGCQKVRNSARSRRPRRLAADSLGRNRGLALPLCVSGSPVPVQSSIAKEANSNSEGRQGQLPCKAVRRRATLNQNALGHGHGRGDDLFCRM